MRLKLWTIRLAILLAIITLSLTLTQAQETRDGVLPNVNGAKIIKQTPSAESLQSDLDDCSQMLQQSIQEARSCKDLADIRLTQIQKRDLLLETDQKLISTLYKIIETSDLLIGRLEKQCSSTSILFGLLKFKKC